MRDITGHIIGAALCILFATFAGLTLYHQYAVDSDPVVQAATMDAMGGRR